MTRSEYALLSPAEKVDFLHGVLNENGMNDGDILDEVIAETLSMTMVAILEEVASKYSMEVFDD